MKKWNVYRNNARSIEAVKEGFNWCAFFFTGLWAFYKGLFWAGVIGLSLTVTANRMPADADVIAIPIIVALMLIYGFMGTNWVCARLEKQGYSRVAQVEAASAEDAKAQLTSDDPSPTSTEMDEDNAIQIPPAPMVDFREADIWEDSRKHIGSAPLGRASIPAQLKESQQTSGQFEQLSPAVEFQHAYRKAELRRQARNWGWLMFFLFWPVSIVVMVVLWDNYGDAALISLSLPLAVGVLSYMFIVVARR